MIILLKKYSSLLLWMAMLSSCSKQHGFGPNYSAYNGGDVPVSVQNTVGNRPDPAVNSSVSDSSITIVMTIPSTSGRTIKEITKVATSSSYAAIQSGGTTGFYPVAAIPGSGTTVTFKTTLGIYRSVYPKETLKLNTELVNRFYFRITLDDGTIVYPTPVRVIVVS
ncbi:MAG TPA: hypothetical protein VL727_14265 [Puia sp.]|jgi:hypothetical protein|nr:hypothetical protein [Puia sp.]